MVPGVLIMTTYKLLLIPHRLPAQRGTHVQGASNGADERYSPFGHLPKEYVQVRRNLVPVRGLFFVIQTAFFVVCRCLMKNVIIHINFGLVGQKAVKGVVCPCFWLWCRAASCYALARRAGHWLLLV